MAFYDPNAVVSNAWTISPSGTANAALDDAVRDPTDARTGGDGAYVTTSTATSVCDIGLADPSVGTGQVVSQVVAKVYASGGAKRSITIDLRYTPQGGSDSSLGTVTVGAGEAAGWKTITVSNLALSSSEAATLHIRMTCNSTAGGGGASAVQADAMYIDVTVSYLDSATISGVTTPSGTDVQERAPTTDAATVSSMSRVDTSRVLSYTADWSDNFDDNSLDAAWLTGGTVQETGQLLRVYGSPASYAYRNSETIVEKVVKIKVASGALDGVSAQQLDIGYVTGSGPLLFMRVSQGGGAGNFTFKAYDTTNLEATSRTYLASSAFPFWVRILERNGYVHWEYSFDDTEWFTLATKATSSLSASTTQLRGVRVSAGVASYAQFDDIISGSITSYGSDELTSFMEYIDSATIDGTTTPSATEISEYVDTDTISGITSPSSVEEFAAVDSDTISGITTPSGTDEYTPGAGGIEYTDSATVTGSTTPSSSELVEFVDAATVAGVTTPSTSDIAAYIEGAPAEAQPTYNNVAQTSASSGAGPYVVTLPSYQAGDLVIIYVVLYNAGGAGNNTLTASGWNVVANSYTQYAWRRIIVLSRIMDGTEGSTVSLTVGGTTTNVVYKADAACYTGVDPVTPLSGSVVLGTGPSASSGAKTINGTHKNFVSVVAIGTSVASPTITNLSPSGTTQRDWLAYAGYLSHAFLLDYPIESASGDYTMSGTLSGGYVYSWVSMILNPATVLGGVTIASVTTLSSAEVAQFVETATVNGITTPIVTEEVAEFADAVTINGITDLSAVELAEYVDDAVIAGSTTPSGEEIYTPLSGTEYTDNAIIAGITDTSAVDIFEAVDSDTISGASTPDSVEIHEIPDADTVSSSTALSAVEVVEYADDAVLACTTTPSSEELHEIPDTETIGGITSPTAVEVFEGVDAAILVGTTDISFTEILEVVDSATIAVTTEPSAVELAEYVDSATVVCVTTPSGTDVYTTYQHNRPTSDIAASGWTPVPGTPTTLYDKLNETSPDNANYIYAVAS